MSAPSNPNTFSPDDVAAAVARDVCFSDDSQPVAELAAAVLAPPVRSDQGRWDPTRSDLHREIVEQSHRLATLLSLWKHEHACDVDFAPAYPTAAQIYLQPEPAAIDPALASPDDEPGSVVVRSASNSDSRIEKRRTESADAYIDQLALELFPQSNETAA